MWFGSDVGGVAKMEKDGGNGKFTNGDGRDKELRPMVIDYSDLRMLKIAEACEDAILACFFIASLIG